MATGPFEFAIIGFEGNQFTGEVLPRVRAFQEKGWIRVVDLLFVKKDLQGQIKVTEITDLKKEESRAYKDLLNTFGGLLSAEDVAQLSSGMPPNSSAAIVLFEHTWAAELREAVLRANGRLLGGGLIRSDEVERLQRNLAASVGPGD